MIRSSILSSYFVSGVIHASVVGLAYVGLVGGFVPPGYGIQAGGNPGGGGSITSPYLDSPFDFGEVATLQGNDGSTLGLNVLSVDPTALDVLKIEPTEVVHQPPTAKPQIKAVEPHNLASLANPVRLPEPTTESPIAITDKLNAPTDKRESALIEPVPTAAVPVVTEPPATPKTEQIASSAKAPATPNRPSAEAPPEPEQLPDRIDSTTTTAESSAPATAKSAARKGDDESGKLAGSSTGQALQATVSAASQASPGTGLPPGVRPDQFPSKLPRNPAPHYPDEAYQQGHEGVVQLLVSVTGQGTVSAVKVHRSSGFESLDQAAVKAVRDWKFQPATYRGAAVAARVLVPVGFQIER